MIKMKQRHLNNTHAVLNTIMLQMEQAESVEDCIVIVEDMLDVHPDIVLHEIDIPTEMNGDTMPPGEYDRAALGNESGFRIQRFAPIVVNHSDTLEITWKFEAV